ncbi:MAG: hypothetical protein IKT98_08050 [Selenomonadaceae bacterium]|nr:hypothetical protein [Selenomonadaceae bacterium]
MFGGLKIEYGGVECGFVILRIKEGFSIHEFIFDEIMSDPFPELVNLYVHVQRGENYSENFFDTYDENITVLKISARVQKERVLVTVELVKKKIILKEVFQRKEFLAMVKKIFTGLLSDKYFPYSYPCFLYITETHGTEFSEAIMDSIANSRSDWTTGDVLNYAFESGRLKLEPRYVKYLEQYKRMLTDFVIPEDWFE